MVDPAPCLPCRGVCHGYFSIFLAGCYFPTEEGIGSTPFCLLNVMVGKNMGWGPCCPDKDCGRSTDGCPVGRRWYPDRRCVVYLLREFLGFLCRGETLFLVCRWSRRWRPCPPRRWPSNLRGICSRSVFYCEGDLDSVTVRRVVTVGRLMMVSSLSRR